jgi:hypothetical protein
MVFNYNDLWDFLSLILTVFIAHSYGISSLILTVSDFHSAEFSTANTVTRLLVGLSPSRAFDRRARAHYIEWQIVSQRPLKIVIEAEGNVW